MLNQIQDLLQHQTALLLPDLVIAYHTQLYSMFCDNMKSIIVDDNLCQDPLSMSKFSHLPLPVVLQFMHHPTCPAYQNIKLTVRQKMVSVTTAITHH